MINTNQILNIDCIAGLKLISDNSIDLVITDPPYEVDYNNKSSQLEKLGKSREDQIKRDASFIDANVEYENVAKELWRVLKNNTHVYLFCGDRQIVKWIQAMTASGFKPPQILVWRKNRTTFDMTFGYKYPENKEFILFFQKGWKQLNGYKVERHGFRSVLNFDSSTDTNYHGCAKPINLLSFLTKASSNKGDICLDLFMGSGNHVIAFMRCERKYIGFEISPEYFKVIEKRIAQEQTQTKLDSMIVIDQLEMI